MNENIKIRLKDWMADYNHEGERRPNGRPAMKLKQLVNEARNIFEELLIPKTNE